MANRALLHRSKLKLFEQWLRLNGWTIEQPKGIYEVLRATGNGDSPLIIFTKDNENSQHLTVQDGNETTVRRFIRETRGYSKEG